MQTFLCAEVFLLTLNHSAKQQFHVASVEYIDIYLAMEAITYQFKNKR